MKHSIRLNKSVHINDTAFNKGDVVELDCDLGSGIKDKNGREIFENDVVNSTYKQRFNVMFDKGLFWLTDPYDHYGKDRLLDYDKGKEVEVYLPFERSQFKSADRAWSPQLKEAYDCLLDAFIACKSPEIICSLAFSLAKVAKFDKCFKD